MKVSTISSPMASSRFGPFDVQRYLSSEIQNRLINQARGLGFPSEDLILVDHSGTACPMFEMVGWRVVTLKYRRLLEAAYASSGEPPI